MNFALLKWKSAEGLEFIKDIEGKISETMPEMIVKFLKFASEYKDLEFHEENPEYDGRCPTPELN